MTTLLSTTKGLIRSFVGVESSTKMDAEAPPSATATLKQAGLFAQCSFAVVRSIDLTNDDAEAVGEK